MLRTLLVKLSLSSKGSLLVFMLVICSGLLVVGAGTQANKQLIKQLGEMFAQQWVISIADQSSAALMDRDAISLQAILFHSAELSVIGGATIFDANGKAVAASGHMLRGQPRFKADIKSGEGVIGHAEISLDQQSLNNEIYILMQQLLLLAVLFAVLSWALVNAPLRRLDRDIVRAWEKLRHPLLEADPPAWPGDDSLGDLLRQIHRQRVIPPTLDAHRSACSRLIIHAKWQEYGRLREIWEASRLERLQRSYYEQLAAVAHVYSAQIIVHSRDGVALVINTGDRDGEAMFHALCVAQLMHSIGDELGAHARIGKLVTEGNGWQIEAATRDLVASLHNAEFDSDRQGIALIGIDPDERKELEPWATVYGDRVRPEPQVRDQLVEQLHRILSAPD